MKEDFKTSRQEIVNDAAMNLLHMFQTGEMPEAITLTIIKRRDGDDQPSFHWSIGNQILMYIQGTMDARGFNQWMKVGRHVNKGTKAVWILAPMLKKVKDDHAPEKMVITGFTPIPVFRFEDTAGEELDKTDYAPRELPPFWDVADRLGVSIQYAPVSGNYYGAFSPDGNKITLCSQDAFVYFHELSHAVHNTFRPLKMGQDAEQEIVAEMAAAVLCEMQGIPGYECQAYNYVEGYAKTMKDGDILKCLMRLLGEVEMVVLKILDVASWDSQPNKAS